MTPIRLAAAALALSAGLAFAGPSLAAQKSASATPAPMPFAGVTLADYNSWQGRHDDRQEWREDRRDDRKEWRHDRRDDRRDWRHDRRDDRRDWRADRRDDWRDWRHDRRAKWRDDWWDRRRAHWRPRYHPRYTYWIGRPAPRVEYIVIQDYRDYYLPPPRYGHYYVRSGSDIYLIAQATHLIVDAFVLLDAASHY